MRNKLELVRNDSKTAMRVAEILGDHIASLPAGSRLSSEREMMEQFHVSRGTLREAIRMLELQGCVSLKRGYNGGLYVEKPDHRPLAGTLSLFIRSSGTTFESVMEARSFVETELAALAAARVTDDALVSIRRSLDAMESEINSIESFLVLNEEFHDLCARAANSDVLEVFHASLNSIADGHLIGIEYSVKRRLAVHAAHTNIYRAIAARNPAASAQAMRAHLGEFDAFVRDRYPQALASQVSVSPSPGAEKRKVWNNDYSSLTAIKTNNQV